MDSFKSKTQLQTGGKTYTIYQLEALTRAGFNIERLPFSIRILLENLLRAEDGKKVTRRDIEALASWDPKKKSEKEIAFTPARVVLQDFTGVPAVVDLAAMRDSLAALGGDPKKINPLQPVDLVIDHSLQVDYFGTPDAFQKNVGLEYDRNQERYRFLKWGQQAFKNFRVVPPGTGIIHQVNLEYLASVIMTREENGERITYPDTLVGTDSHTTMINGLGVLGWGVGGIEAEAAMLGQPVSMLIPEVVGFRLFGKLPEGVTATDLVLTITEMLRKKGVVGKFVEFFGPGLDVLSLADRATVANMAPEYGATMGFFPVDQETLNYLRFSGRSEETVQLAEAYLKAQHLLRTEKSEAPVFSDVLELNLSEVEASIAGPKKPQERLPLKRVKEAFQKVLPQLVHSEDRDTLRRTVKVEDRERSFELRHGSVVIASITSCTNTSNPAVLIAAGLLAKRAVEKGLQTKPWVKTSLSPGSKVVTEYLKATGLLKALEQLNFHLVGYGCTTCIGNSGPLAEAVGKAILDNQLMAAAVLSGNRNFEGRVNPLVKANYLASPPLVVAYALCGRMDIDFYSEPIGKDAAGKEVFLKDLWPSNQEIQQAMGQVTSGMFRSQYGHVFEGDQVWRSVRIPAGDRFSWESQSTYVKHPPYFENLKLETSGLSDIQGARVLAVLGDMVTTDHISPAGSIAKTSPAAKYLMEKGVQPADFNSYGSRRGNHEVMMRGTFANIRLKNLLAAGTEGGVTCHFPDGASMSIFDAAMKYREEKTPLIVVAGKEYGAGSSRDWAAKGPALLGVKAVIAESYERIHRSNLVGMGILPLQFKAGESRDTLGLKGNEIYSILGIETMKGPSEKLTCRVQTEGGEEKSFQVICRIDTPIEIDYYRNGGILQFVLRQMLKG